MKAKLQLLMDALQMRPGQFARTLDVNPAIISHILAERNKPGVELLQKILTKFPQVNPDWLLLDNGAMFRNEAAIGQPQLAAETSAPEPEPSLFASATPPTAGQRPDVPSTPETQNMPANASMDSQQAVAPIYKKTITHAVLFYADGTFESFVPGKLHP